MAEETTHPIRHVPGPLELLWRWLNSLPVAIVVMVLLALLSAVGTLIPQSHLDPQPPGLTFEQFLTSRYGAEKYRILHFLGFDRVYFTWYFNGLLIWLAVSAVICNIVRYRRTVALWKNPPARRGASFFRADRRSRLYSAAPTADNELNAPALSEVGAAEAFTAVADDLRALGYRVRRDDSGNAHTLYADRGFLQKWALVVLHVSILILLFGGMYGHAVGVNGTIRMADSEQQTLTLDLLEGKQAWVKPLLKRLPELSYDLHQHGFRIDYSRKLLLETSLQRNVPEDLQEYYYYFVHDYVSDLEVTHRGETRRAEVLVNHPLIVNKLYLYQSGYDQRGYLSLTLNGETRELRIPDPIVAEQWMALTPDGVVVLDEGGRWFATVEQGEFIVKEFVQPGTPVSNFSFRLEPVKAGILIEKDKQVGTVGPLTLATLRDNTSGMSMGSLIMDTQRGFDLRVGEQVVRVRMADKVDNYSIFAYKRDPGAPVLLLGWLLLVASIALTLYVPFTQVWARAEDGQLKLLALGREAQRLRRRVDAMLGA